MIIIPEKLTKTQKEKCVNQLFDQSTPNLNFFLMLVMSAIIVSIGLLKNNVAVIIGGMLIAPLLSPILSFSMGIVVGDTKLMRRSVVIISWSIFIVIAVSFLISMFTIGRELTPEVTSRIYPSMAYFLIAVFSGFAVAYAISRPSVNEILPGVAIAVAIIPPLSVVGIAVSFFNWDMIVGAFGLFALNLLGVIFAALIVFSILNFYEVKKSVEKKIKAEEKIIEEEKKIQQQEHIEELAKTVKQATELLKESKDK